MSFFQVRQVTSAGERKTLINLSAPASMQEITPDRDFSWHIGLEPMRAIIFLQAKLEPIISVDRAEDLIGQVTGNPSELKKTLPILSKEPK